ncbi:MAG: hypothetical protein QNJ55_13365 [Xenococcus sp. MO_188.B8]|nr:hypothetical protein [Xenococcus sp. MO_188.B8]
MTTALEKEVAKAPKSTQKAISKIIKTSDREPLKAAFLTRVIEGLIEIADSYLSWINEDKTDGVSPSA